MSKPCLNLDKLYLILMPKPCLNQCSTWPWHPVGSNPTCCIQQVRGTFTLITSLGRSLVSSSLKFGFVSISSALSSLVGFALHLVSHLEQETRFASLWPICAEYLSQSLQYQLLVLWILRCAVSCLCFRKRGVVFWYLPIKVTEYFVAVVLWSHYIIPGLFFATFHIADIRKSLRQCLLVQGNGDRSCRWSSGHSKL